MQLWCRFAEETWLIRSGPSTTGDSASPGPCIQSCWNMLIDDKIPIQLNYTPYSEVTSDVLWVGRSIVIQPGLSDNMLELIYKQALGCVLHITISARVSTRGLHQGSPPGASTRGLHQGSPSGRGVHQGSPPGVSRPPPGVSIRGLHQGSPPGVSIAS